ncbi:MAG: ferritin [Romboutsia sp.]|nr:ferritin [Romboutsia sp.]
MENNTVEEEYCDGDVCINPHFKECSDDGECNYEGGVCCVSGCDMPTFEHEDYSSQTSNINNDVSARQNFSNKVEKMLNTHIGVEMNAFHCYLSLAAYFNKDNVSLHGFSAFFQKSSDEELAHAKMFIDYINDRGGRYKSSEIKSYNFDEITPLDALQTVLELEKMVNDCLLDIHKVASESGDPHLSDFLEEHFLTEQVNSIRELTGMIARLKIAGTYLFDLELSKK